HSRGGRQVDALSVRGGFLRTVLNGGEHPVGEGACSALLGGTAVTGDGGVPLARVRGSATDRALRIGGEEGGTRTDVGRLIRTQPLRGEFRQSGGSLEGVQEWSGGQLGEVGTANRARVVRGQHLGRHVRQVHGPVAAAGAAFPAVGVPRGLV